eukprot:14968142-Alexandrium_andersonii.AAC.1
MARTKALAGLWAEMNAWAAAHKLRAPKGHTFSKKAFGKEQSALKYPELHTVYKASTCKRICIFVAEKMRRICDGTWRSRLRALTTWALAKYIHTCDISGTVMTRAEARDAHHYGHICLLAYQRLAADASAAGAYLWRLRPKFHYWDHGLMELNSLRINPK